MHVQLVGIFLTIVFAILAWYINNMNPVPVLKQLINVLIVIVSVLFVLQFCGLIHFADVSLSK